MATQIVGVDGMAVSELKDELARGGRFVVFEYCISIVVMTFKRSSAIYFIRAGQNSLKHSAGFTLLSLVARWWGIPWGPIYTIGSVVTNVAGGRDVTQGVIAALMPTAPTPETAPSKTWNVA